MCGQEENAAYSNVIPLVGLEETGREEYLHVNWKDLVGGRRWGREGGIKIERASGGGRERKRESEIERREGCERGKIVGS